MERVDAAQGLRQRALAHRRRFHVIKRRGADGEQLLHRLLALRATIHMRGNDEALARRQRARGEAKQPFVRGVMGYHRSTPVKDFLRFAMARRMRDFTVPRGMPSAAAIRPCDSSSKKAIFSAAA